MNRKYGYVAGLHQRTTHQSATAQALPKRLLLSGVRVPVWLMLLVPALLCSLAGCSLPGSLLGSPGSIQAISLSDEPVVLSANFTTAYYAHDPTGEATFMLCDVPLDKLLSGEIDSGQILHVDVIWLPKAGMTPMDPSSTNAIIRYVVIANGEVGVYGGAGFALPNNDPGVSALTLTIRDASIQLLEATPGFADLLSPGQITGTLTATHNAQRTQQMRRAASQLVTDALGRTRYVWNNKK